MRGAWCLVAVVIAVNFFQGPLWMDPALWLLIDLCAIAALLLWRMTGLAVLLSARALLHSFQLGFPMPDLLYHQIANGMYGICLMMVLLSSGWYWARRA